MKFSDRIKPSISGHMAFVVDAKDERIDEFEDVLNLIKQRTKLRWKKTGSYTFSGGIVSHLYLDKSENGNIRASLKFMKAKPHFLDNLANAIQYKANSKTISCCINGDLDYEKIRSFLKKDSDWFAESKEGFAGDQNSNEYTIRITVYPKLSILNLLFEFKDEVCDSDLPSKTIKNICKIGGGIV